jgi:hypothetical protein
MPQRIEGVLVVLNEPQSLLDGSCLCGVGVKASEPNSTRIFSVRIGLLDKSHARGSPATPNLFTQNEHFINREVQDASTIQGCF